MTFFNELATNASNNGVQILMYVGNDDAISPHFGTEGGYLSFLSSLVVLTMRTQSRSRYEACIQGGVVLTAVTHRTRLSEVFKGLLDNPAHHGGI